jgi:hypothetical protein
MFRNTIIVERSSSWVISENPSCTAEVEAMLLHCWWYWNASLLCKAPHGEYSSLLPTSPIFFSGGTICFDLFLVHQLSITTDFINKFMVTYDERNCDHGKFTVKFPWPFLAEPFFTYDLYKNINYSTVVLVTDWIDDSSKFSLVKVTNRDETKDTTNIFAIF